ncbi:cytochrome C [Blattabacterium sp. (Cryptocercus kyebangensis)]|uniref:c-type cytochrome n=1 Tax=Blattabacterium sp. (Cryptocercus kyebangensis) TaxID=298656 RepID=UPI000D7C1372|nr:c-type cytochrome [Blattabacterium sp. (Cryptocercus kyebangensis)]AWU43948.1 cytochrome C [Blattabacterium sp. (Cryptocercus kyebangensis)]
MKNFLFSVFFSFSTFIFLIEAKNIEGNFKKGKELFKQNCTSCHSLDLEKKMIGPALYGVTEKRNREWLHKWIIDNKSLRNSGDKEAISIYKEYGNVEMNSFPKLSEQQIDDILSFIKKPKQDNKQEQENKQEFHNNLELEKNKFLIKIIFFGLFIISTILFWILYKVYILTHLLSNDFIFTEKKKKNFWILSYLFLYKFLGYKKKNWYFLSSFIGFFFILGIYGIWIFLMEIDVNKGYKPEQPIYFSHKIHSGINGIDCQYCHSSAKYSKVSGIPSANICMNCHITINEYKGNYIEKGKSRDEYNKEIQKIYDSVGWNPELREFSKKTHPIQWIRIHNMPDFVYFDHSQHIITGEKMIKKSKKVDLSCNACHGKVQDMDQVEMANSFTMEWCISCHKNTEIDTENQYYKEYFPNFIKKRKERKITVDMIGGLECAKCHY